MHNRKKSNNQKEAMDKLKLNEKRWFHKVLDLITKRQPKYNNNNYET